MADKHAIEQSLAIMAKLRDPDSGCPWDLKQDFKSIVPHTLEEAYEVADCIEKGELTELKSELGDLLFQVIFYAQLEIVNHRAYLILPMWPIRLMKN